jgi:hypothetical protein
MTNKRKHQLEREVRINFRNFNDIIYPKYVWIDFLEQITRLMLDRIQLLRYTRRLNIIEARFMAQCVRTYYWYYILEIDKNFFD